jgi:hypothetical protein
MPEDRTQYSRPPLERSKSLIERWPCEVEKCRNHGQLCYWTISDTADDHLPVTSIIMQHWLAAITRGECTVDVPPPQVIEQWQRQNLRALQDRVKRRERQAERMAARNSASPRVALYRFRQGSRPNPVKNPAKPTTTRCPDQAAGDSARMSVG